jgi:ferrochelatase
MINETETTGVLLTNVGTPASPTPAAVKGYLKEFLSDRRVVEIPKLAWWPLLHGIILQSRPKKSAALYQKIWTENGSPLLLYSQNIAKKLQNQIGYPVAIGMHYGQPSIKNALEKLRASKVKKIIVLPLFPQYSATTTASSLDKVSDVLKTWRIIPKIQTITHYADHPAFIRAISISIQKAWKTQGQAQHLLFSYHGIPKKYADLGDPYPELCYRTARLVAETVKLSQEQWSVAFQSRLGRAEWLTPYTNTVLAQLPQKKITNVQVICPGFAVDCLETLEEIAMRGKEQFIQAGGEKFYYISGLNDTMEHINVLISILSDNGVKENTHENSKIADDDRIVYSNASSLHDNTSIS